MELLFVVVLVVLMAGALASGYPVAFALPGSAILTIALAGLTGEIFAGDASAFFAQGGPIQWLNAGVTNFRGIYWEAERDTLIAIPLFVFMGIMLERSKIAEDLLVTMAQLFGPVPGGLGISVVFVGALLAATTGIVGATVIAMGLISLPVMLRNNYSKALASGTIAASGTLGQIIPPSIVLIILADQLSNATDQALTLRKAEYKLATGSSSLPGEFGLTSASAGDMFLGAFLPGLVLVGLYILFILVLALIRPKLAPPVHYEGKFDAKFAARVLLVLVPPLTLIFVVLGSILLGIATVNQAGAIGAIGAMIMAGYRLTSGKRTSFVPAILAVVSLAAILFLISTFDINVKNIQDSEDALGVTLAAIAVAVFLFSVIWSGWRVYKIDKTLEYVMIETAKTSSLVFIILLGAAMLTAAFRSFGGEDLVREFLGGLPGGFIAKFVLVMAVIFVLGFFLDFIEIAVVVVPIIAPILLADPSANVTAVWLGVMIGVNMQTSFLTPPFGFALFYLRGVAPPDVRTVQIYRGVVPFIFLQLGALFIVGAYPPLVNYLPNRVYLTSETAPPPTNPRLQACLEEFIFDEYDQRQTDLRAGIDRAASLNISYLPPDLQESLSDGLASAKKTFDMVNDIREADAAFANFLPNYEPLHREVRGLQKQMGRLDEETKQLKRDLGRLERTKDAPIESLDAISRKIEENESEKAQYKVQIPDGWTQARKEYTDLEKAESKARNLYRRNVDGAYEVVATVRTLIASADELAALEPQLEGLNAAINGEPPEQAMETINEAERAVGAVAGGSDIRSALSKARRALKGDNPDRAEAREHLFNALKLYAAEVSWRQQAGSELAADLEEYDNAIKDTIGIRLQERLPVDLATDIAACLSPHSDISLHF
ncbi:MAG: TRAP transporter large permease subunit [Alphaproteobacteria bacterium]|nr:TRAP transporter large permease subunit [Alphaproteobacteria bacterium]